MQTQSTTTEHGWTALRLFKVGLGGFIASLLGVLLAGALWWPLAFDWDSDKLPLPAYIDIYFGVIAIVIGAASIAAMLASGIRAFLYSRSES